jgi:Coenzyme PQQ synthesis protein D (PqqD)
MSNPSSPVNSLPAAGQNTGSFSLYLQHPGSARMDDKCIIPGTSYEIVELSDAASFVYDQLQEPHTRANLTSIFEKQFDASLPEASARVGMILRSLVERGLAIEISPGGQVPTDPHAWAKHLLRQAQRQLRLGDWSKAAALCQEAGKDPAFAAVAELNTLIARYRGSNFDGMVEQVCMLSARLTGASQACCDALAMLAAHRTGDLVTAKLVALHLSRRYQSSWDLPTVPNFAILARGQVVVTESLSVDPMLAVIEDLQKAGVGSPDENALLSALAQQYRERKAGSNV